MMREQIIEAGSSDEQRIVAIPVESLGAAILKIMVGIVSDARARMIRYGVIPSSKIIFDVIGADPIRIMTTMSPKKS